MFVQNLSMDNQNLFQVKLAAFVFKLFQYGLVITGFVISAYSIYSGEKENHFISVAMVVGSYLFFRADFLFKKRTVEEIEERMRDNPWKHLAIADRRKMDRKISKKK